MSIFPGRVLTAHERLQALLQASMNQEAADACSAEQPALRALLESNAALFRKLAQ